MTRRMLLRGRPILLLATLTFAMVAGEPSDASAQRFELQILGGQVSDATGVVGRGLTLAPTIAWEGATRWLRLDGRATALEGGGRVMGAGGAFHVALARVGAVELGTTGNAGLLGASGGLRSLSAEVAPGARLYIGESSVGAGVGLRAASLSSASAEWRRALPLGDQGEARTSVAHSFWADGRARVGRGTLGVLGRASRANGVQWTEAHVGASLALGALTLSGFAGGRTGFRGEQWGGGGAALRVASGVELVGQLARQPSDPLTGQPGARTAALGITLSHGGQPARSSGRPRAVRLSLRAIPGARVELMGDWNDWRPEPVTDQGGGVFAGEVHLTPGIYHFVFRVNGELFVPEGYDTAPDDFGGRSAVVRVRG